jgi:hypothetical protein
MATIVADEKTLKLVVDTQGIVWYIQENGLPTNAKCGVDCFLETSSVLQSADYVRVIGIPNHAGLIHKLYEKKLKQEFAVLQVGTPMCCVSADDRRDPELFLYYMRKLDRPPSLGGWHDFDLRDLSSYLLADHHFLSDEPANSLHVRCHPAWPALSFVDGLNEAAVAKMLAAIVDPRWFIDGNAPDKLDRYEDFLQLNTKSIGQAAHQDATWRSNRSKMVLQCWKNLIFKSGQKMINPRHFVFRAWADKGGGHKGELEGCKTFARFLWAVWTQAMYIGPRSDRLFIPEHFFSRPDEVLAYKTHLEEQNKKHGDDNGEKQSDAKSGGG